MTAFIYKNPEDLLAAQKVMIDLAKHLIESCDQVPLALRPLYYENLTMVISRGELALNFIGFEEGMYDNILKDDSKSTSKTQSATLGPLDPKCMSQKMKVATSYQTFLYETLRKALDILNRDANTDKEQTFVEIFCAIAYFRIPEFRQKLLGCFEKANDAEITINECRGNEWLLENAPDDSKTNKQVTALFDWNKNFYEHLKVIVVL